MPASDAFNYFIGQVADGITKAIDNMLQRFEYFILESHFRRDENLSAEAFAEMYSAVITQSDSLTGIKDFFPKLFKLFQTMMGDAL